MATRTYVPQLLNLLRRVCLYLIRYRDKIKANGDAGTGEAMDALIAACNDLIALLPVDLPEP